MLSLVAAPSRALCPDNGGSLDLSAERIPKAIWLAAVPPFITVGIILWLWVNWGDWPVRFGASPAVLPPTDDPSFRTIVQFLLAEMAMDVWFVSEGLATWYGTPRRFTFRRAMLMASVADIWGGALIVPAVIVPVWLRLSPLTIALWAVAGAAGIAMMFVFKRFTRQARREHSALDLPASSWRMYFDRGDPSVFSERGTNLGNPWNWVTFSLPALIFFVPMLLLG